MDLGRCAGHRMANGSEGRGLMQLLSERRKVFSQSWISFVTGGILVAFFEELVERDLRCFAVIERDAVRQWNQAVLRYAVRT